MSIPKHEWRRSEKNLYFPKNKPEVIDVPAFKFVTIRGKGNPNAKNFAEHIAALYPVAYAIKMNLKKLEVKPENYVDFTVYPLEGVWDITDEAKKTYDGTFNKDDLVYQIMLRQPNFISLEFFEEMLDFTKKKKTNPLFEKINFEIIEEGKCIQMMHLGSYDNEPASFAQMEDFALEQGLQRESKLHREIYLSDFRKVPKEKLKTVLRFKVI
jgi:hypothetical protein